MVTVVQMNETWLISKFGRQNTRKKRYLNLKNEYNSGQILIKAAHKQNLAPENHNRKISGVPNLVLRKMIREFRR